MKKSKKPKSTNELAADNIAAKVLEAQFLSRSEINAAAQSAAIEELMYGGSCQESRRVYSLINEVLNARLTMAMLATQNKKGIPRAAEYFKAIQRLGQK